MTCLEDALSTSVGYERKRIVIKATVEKNVMVYGLKAVWHSCLLALFFTPIVLTHSDASGFRTGV